MKQILIIFLVLNCFFVKLIITYHPWHYESYVYFMVFNNHSKSYFLSTFDKKISESDCDPEGKFAFIMHGWQESYYSLWVHSLIRKLTYYRGGCVIFMQYTLYSSPNYFALTPHFFNLASVLRKKVRHVTKNLTNVYMFGFSFGARLAFEAGAQLNALGDQKVEDIHACDPAGPGFDPYYYYHLRNPKAGAKNVYCINTSNSFGTKIYNCHVNFRMGYCGYQQAGASFFPYGSHGLCPYFYISAFDNDFVKYNYYQCGHHSYSKHIPKDFKMGYMETRRSNLYYGDVFIPTTRYRPWNVKSPYL